MLVYGHAEEMVDSAVYLSIRCCGNLPLEYELKMYIRIRQFSYYYYSMKSFSRVQKKGILTARAIENNRLNNSQNFDEMVEKQLEDDFKVHQYLNDNPNEGHNTEEYTTLFNTLLVKKFHKTQKKQLLKSNKAKLQPNDLYENENSSKGKTKRQVDTYYTEEEYLRIKQESEAQQEIIEQKTQQELEMKNVLLKQISENKKSLNLLKGDIGHMIARNESISVLQSKVNKVSLVSQNQLKRVSLALSKDKEQVQLRQEMQKRFHNKLKVVQSLQNRSLRKIKLSYIETMKRRKQIFDNLGLIQKECASIEEYSDKHKQKQQKNSKTLALFRLLKFVRQTIRKSSQLWTKFELKEITCLEYCKEVRDIYKYQQEADYTLQKESQDFEIDQITPESLSGLKMTILQEFERLEKETKQKKKVYKELVSKIEECWVKISNYDKKIEQVLIQFNQQERNELNLERFSIEDYFRTFNHLKSNFNILYLLIGFFTKKHKSSFGGKELVNQIYENQCFHAKIQENQQQISNFDEILFTEIEAKLKFWFENLMKKVQIWEKIPEYMKQQWRNKLRKQVQFNLSKITQMDPENLAHSKRYEIDEEQQNSDPDENENEGNKLINQLNDKQDKSTMKGTKTSTSQSKHMEEETAKRIQILTKIDQSYYRMIKETIQMEKENTMKNYEFKRSFKRNKYSSQDELLEEKRFEATFSGLFKQDSDNISRPSKMKNSTFQIKKAINGKSMFSSVHQTKSKISLNTSVGEFRNKNSSVWEKQKRLKLRSKLQDVLSQG